MNTKHLHSRANLKHSETVERIPAACADELKAVEFLEEQRWGKTPCCVHCGSVNVYKMLDSESGQRNSRFLWKCRDCQKQYTVRVGTVYEESRIPLRHWVYAFWAACASKKGVSALQIKRQTGISYKSALFMMHRIRFAMTESAPAAESKMTGVVECDETYCGGKPRPGSLTAPNAKAGRGTSKTPVFGMVERGGRIRRKVVANVTGATLKKAMRESIDPAAHIMTDGYNAYRGVAPEFASHQKVEHSVGEYVRGNVHTNTIESSFSLLKRGLIGTFHAVSKEHLHRYVAEFDFKWNTRRVNDGQRVEFAIQNAEGKRLSYADLTGSDIATGGT
jgi:transposase-like protein